MFVLILHAFPARYLLTEDAYALREFSAALCSLDAEGAMDLLDVLANNLDYDGITQTQAAVITVK